MARAHLGGHLINREAGLEYDCFSCAHCQKEVWVPQGQGATSRGGWCFRCAAPVCFECAGRECEPFEKKLERWEARGRLLRAMGL